MAKLIDLLEGFTGTSAQELQSHIQSRASELKLKLFLDDGDKNIFVPKARLDSEIVKNVELKKSLAENEAAMKKLESITKDNEKAQSTIAELQTSMEQMKETMKENNLALAVRAKAMELGAIDETGKDLLAFIDKSKLVVNEDGTVTGLDEATASLKASKAYLFNTDTKTPTDGGTGAPGRPAADDVPGSESSKAGSFGASLSQQMGLVGKAVNLTNTATVSKPTYDFFK